MSKVSIIKFYRIIREIIKNITHKTLKDNLLGTKPCENGKSYIEIDESKSISYNGEVNWMFDLYDIGSN